MTVEGVEVAIGALVRDVPAEHRLEAVRRLVRALHRVYDLQPGTRPEWLDRLATTWLDDEWPEGEEEDFDDGEE